MPLNLATNGNRTKWLFTINGKTLTIWWQLIIDSNAYRRDRAAFKKIFFFAKLAGRYTAGTAAEL